MKKAFDFNLFPFTLYLAFFLWASITDAEYRAFLLKITSQENQTPLSDASVIRPDSITNSSDSNFQKQGSLDFKGTKGENLSVLPTQSFRLVKSNLDPEQYATYYPLAKDEVVTYIDTWMCKGRTDSFLPICSKPEKRKPDGSILIPSQSPPSGPSAVPSSGPSAVPSSGPSAVPSSGPSAVPSSGPSAVPSSGPSAVPSSGRPSAVPAAVP